MRWYTCFVAGDVVAAALAHGFAATYAGGETAIEILEVSRAMAGDISGVSPVLLQRITERILGDIARPICVSSLGEKCLVAYVMGEGDIHEDVDEVLNYDGPDNWSITDCANWLIDEDLIQEAGEWADAITDPYSYLNWPCRDEGLAEQIYRIIEGAVARNNLLVEVEADEDGDLDKEAWAKGAWDLLEDSGRKFVYDLLLKNIESWAENEDEWRDVVRDNWKYPEVYMWFAMDDRFTRALAEDGEVVMSAFDLDMWGRQCAGQAIYMDYVIQKVASRWWKYYADEFPEIKEYL